MEGVGAVPIVYMSIGSFAFFNHQIHSPAKHLSEPLSTGLLIFHSFPVMTAFITYQPRENAPSFGSHTFSKSPTVGLPSWVSSRQGPKSPQRMIPVNNVDFIDLTISNQNAASLTSYNSGRTPHQSSIQQRPTDHRRSGSLTYYYCRRTPHQSSIQLSSHSH